MSRHAKWELLLAKAVVSPLKQVAQLLSMSRPPQGDGVDPELQHSAFDGGLAKGSLNIEDWDYVA